MRAVRAAVEDLDLPSCQIARLPSTTAPGTSALKLDDSEQVPPTVVLAVATQGTVIGSGVSWAVAGSRPRGPVVAVGDPQAR